MCEETFHKWMAHFCSREERVLFLIQKDQVFLSGHIGNFKTPFMLLIMQVIINSQVTSIFLYVGIQWLSG